VADTCCMLYHLLGFTCSIVLLSVLQRVQWLKPEDASNPRDIIKVSYQLLPGNNTKMFE